MKSRKFTKPLGLILIIYTLFSSSSLCACAASYSKKEESVLSAIVSEEEALPALSDNTVVSSRLWELFSDKKSEQSKMLLVGGDVFGVKIKTKSVTVTESKGIPAIHAGDVIISVNGKEITSAEEVKRIVAGSGGEAVTIRALHGGNEIGVEIRPRLEDGEYKIGLALRDGAVGIGTVTFIDPETGIIGGLGHGICDAESGNVIEMKSGEISGVILGGVHKGEAGKPGELSGILTEQRLGKLYANTEEGVFGITAAPGNRLGKEAKPSKPDNDKNSPSLGSQITSRLLPTGTRDEVHEGEATIISTVKNGKTAEYKIEIESIDRSSTGSKSFRIKVTDEALKALTGGIVRGMSGSPIIQDGKLVGAVTHVMVADPTEGYGIFIENMLNAANNINNSGQKAA